MLRMHRHLMTVCLKNESQRKTSANPVATVTVRVARVLIGLRSLANSPIYSRNETLRLEIIG